MIEFYSYENWHHEYARVHIGGCRFCNHGRGLFGGGRTPNGEWHGPFRSAALARGAVSNRVSDIQDCSFCTPPEFDFSDDLEPEPGDTVIELRDGAIVIYEAGSGIDEADDNEDTNG